MLRYALFLFLLPLVGTAADAELSALVKKQMDPLIESGKVVGGVTLVARDGEILDLQAHGMADRAAGRKMTTDTIFRIHSFTKGMTCAAAMMLYEQGKFQFDDPVEKYIPSFKGKGILVRHLFTHSSGITYANNKAFDAGSMAQVADALATNKLPYAPGEGWSYGASIDVIGRLIEVWGGQDYADFMHARLFTPLGMADTAFYVPESKRDRLAKLYIADKKNKGQLKGTSDWNANGEPIPSQRPPFCMPGGGLFSTAKDLSQFYRMISNGGEWQGKRYVKTESVALMRTNQLDKAAGWVRFGKQVRDGFGYGYGFNAVTQKSNWAPAARVGEFGWGGLCSCHYWMHPKNQLVVVTLEQTLPYNWNMENALKGPVYEHFGY
jgi:CubicO group peptidase (beta-lactamase class C family)